MKIMFQNNIELRIGSTLISELKRYVRENGTYRESGGILIGTQSTTQNIYEVTRITFPPAYDDLQRLSFTRHKARANGAIRSAWLNSNGKENYLGEWHTHDEPSPRPSKMDERAIKRLARHTSYSFEHLFLVILGNSNKIFIETATLPGGTILGEEVELPWPD